MLYKYTLSFIIAYCQRETANGVDRSTDEHGIRFHSTYYIIIGLIPVIVSVIVAINKADQWIFINAIKVSICGICNINKVNYPYTYHL